MTVSEILVNKLFTDRFLLRNSNFNRLPDITVYTLTVDLLDVDVIHIADAPHKPYFLSKDKKVKGTTVRFGVVYSRNGSSNTPIDQTASETEIEKMWRERFGIDKSPAARVKKYLLDVDCWVHDQSTQFYDPFPEFTIQENFAEHHPLDSNQEWSRGEIGYHYNPGNSATQMLIRYHQTCLSKIHVVVFDGGKKSLVAPSWEPVDAGRFYFYLKDSAEYAYQCYLVKTQSGTDHSKGLSFTHDSVRQGTYDIPAFQNKVELEMFLSTFSQSFLLEPSVDQSAQNELWYSALEKYNKWKTENSMPSLNSLTLSAPQPTSQDAYPVL